MLSYNFWKFVFFDSFDPKKQTVSHKILTALDHFGVDLCKLLSFDVEEIAAKKKCRL